MNATTATEMVAADQLFKSVLQRYNTEIADKETEFESVFCPKGFCVKPMIDCNICELKDKCTAKPQIDTLKTEYQTLVDGRLQVMNKYATLQDNIKSFVLS